MPLAITGMSTLNKPDHRHNSRSRAARTRNTRHPVRVRRLVPDYLQGCRYAFTRPWRGDRDQWVHHHVVASVAGFVLAGVGVVEQLSRGLSTAALWCLAFLAFGFANAWVVVDRYRRRDKPETERMAAALDTLGARIADRVLDRRDRRNKDQ